MKPHTDRLLLVNASSGTSSWGSPRRSFVVALPAIDPLVRRCHWSANPELEGVVVRFDVVPWD